ncbi:MAG: SDR family oxidoreductase [Myxococcota bacterium]|nr:SDR family oxidoreductase [Myxococcota bacterium]
MSVCVISGSASGIGAATRRRCETAGDRVVGIDLRGAEVEADLSHPEGREKAIGGALEQCQGQIDRLVLCAGVGQTAPLEMLPSINYFGAVELLDGLLSSMSGRRDAAAVVLSSNSVRMVRFDDHPFVAALLEGDEAGARKLIEAEQNGFLAYAGGKLALAKAIRRRTMDWGRAGVRLNAIAPGPTETPLLEQARAVPALAAGLEGLPNPLGRHAAPEEIAEVIHFLLSPEAAYVHGAVLFADAGIDAAMNPDEL